MSRHQESPGFSRGEDVNVRRLVAAVIAVGMTTLTLSGETALARSVTAQVAPSGDAQAFMNVPSVHVGDRTKIIKIANRVNSDEGPYYRGTIMPSRWEDGRWRPIPGYAAHVGGHTNRWSNATVPVYEGKWRFVFKTYAFYETVDPYGGVRQHVVGRDSVTTVRTYR